MQRIASSTPKNAAGKVHYIQNSVPYIEALEEGHSGRQAPHGMVGLTVAKYQGMVDEAVAKVAK
jgi:hypothetical protein